MSKKIKVEEKILNLNEKYARLNEKLLKKNNIPCFNLISSPGAGKTTLLSATIQRLKNTVKPAVIVGDIATDIDAEKIRLSKAPAVQINTDGACHLSAKQVNVALKRIFTKKPDIIFIENVGNLVCPSAFQLGETAKITILSTAEGNDKPAKYPGSFAGSKAVIINKIDLLKTGAVDFDIQKVKDDIRKLNQDIIIFELSAFSGENMETWCDWLKKQADQLPV